MRILVCGGREYGKQPAEREQFAEAMRKYAFGAQLIISGGARGADTLAFYWATAKGIPAQEYPADWDRLGSFAGHVRNQKMLDEGKPHLVIAFPGGRGTADMTRRARKAGIPVVVVT